MFILCLHFLQDIFICKLYFVFHLIKNGLKKNIIPGINNYLDKLITAEGETQYMKIGREIPPIETQRIKKRMHKKVLKSVRWPSK